MFGILHLTAALLCVALAQQPDIRFPCTSGNGREGVCTFLHECAAVHAANGAEQTLTECNVSPPDGIPGICCPIFRLSPQDDEENLIPIAVHAPKVESGTPVQPNQFEAAVKNARTALRIRDELEELIAQNGIFLSMENPSFKHRAFLRTTKEALELGRQAFLMNSVSEELLKGNVNEGTSFRNTPMESLCPKQPRCPQSKYRTIDGSCNNQENGEWGKALRAFNRLLLPKYADGVSRPRITVAGTELPAPRLLSIRIVRDVNNQIEHLTQITMQWGQWLTHDISLTPLSTAKDNSAISCCAQDGRHLAPQFRHPECFPIDVSPNDFFYRRFRQTCLQFVRSMPGRRLDCRVGPREQMNQNTAYIDGSQIYGSDATLANDLRSFRGGQLKTGRSTGGVLLPPSNNANQFLFKAGDPRTNEQMLLATLHTLWMREHNRIALILSRLNPRWNDEIIYQETRRIVFALNQHITFSEYLPVVLGQRIMKRFKLQLQQSGFSSDYDPSIDATVLNEFTTAAHRYGHSLVTGRVVFFNEVNLKPTASNRLHQMFFNPAWLHARGGVDRFTRCLATQNPNAVDAYLTFDLTNLLFQNDDNQPGLDLASFNIQRGRDHGLAGYNAYRKMCGESELKSFADLTLIFTEDVATEMTRLYSHVDDIDLWLGVISETPVSGGIVGPTGACIIAEQMRRLKFGDRFFYENGKFANAFSEAQLNEIRKVTMARIFCDNSDIRQIQPLAFFKPSGWNSVRSCASIPFMNLEAWTNEPVNL